MPNWVRNHLIIHGKNALSVLQSLLTESEEEKGKMEFDFNKIKPMPEELNIKASRVAQNSAKLFLNSMEEYSEEYIRYGKLFKQAYNGDYFMLIGDEAKMLMKETMACHDLEAEGCPLLFANYNEVLDYGKRVLDNFANYGVVDWYDWRCKNWGTKWNASETEIPADGTAEVYFDTAWSPVTNLMQELSKQHPDCKFDYEYAEEQTAFMTGKFELENGEVSGDKFKDYSKPAFETFFRLWGCEDEFTYDEEEGTYKPIKTESEME